MNVVKKIFSQLPAECGEKEINIKELSDSWSIGLRSGWHAGGERFDPVYGSFIFVKKPVYTVKKKFHR